MFHDARKLAAGANISADICIVGAGAAGIAMARQLQGRNLKVCLVESGGLSFEADTQALYEGKNTGRPYYALDVIRLRYFGGTTNHWAGACRPLEPIVFEPRPWVPHSGWPIRRSDLDPYYAPAQKLCQIGPFDYAPDDWAVGADGPVKLDSPARIVTEMFQQSPPTRFGSVYRHGLETSDNVRVLLHANVVEIETTPDGASVTRLRGACLDGKEFSLEAGAYVLATGALENARLMLASKSADKRGVGNGHDLVGRYFMEHLNLLAGALLPSDPTLPLEFYQAHDVRGTEVYGVLTPSEEALRKEKLLSIRANLTPASARQGIKFAAPALVESVVAYHAGDWSDLFGHEIWKVASDMDDLAIYSYESLFDGDDSLKMYYLDFEIEQQPNPDSRVTLIDELDHLGMPRIALDWQYGEPERRTLAATLDLMAREFGRSGLGRIRALPNTPGSNWPGQVRGGWHQIGTTRMSEKPEQGVVDADCRVHGIANLFVAGSSVFPTCGHSNPTLTIIALALRLADHLASTARADS